MAMYNCRYSLEPGLDLVADAAHAVRGRCGTAVVHAMMGHRMRGTLEIQCMLQWIAIYPNTLKMAACRATAACLHDDKNAVHIGSSSTCMHPV